MKLNRPMLDKVIEHQIVSGATKHLSLPNGAGRGEGERGSKTAGSLNNFF
jgi:hypothetical protein